MIISLVTLAIALRACWIIYNHYDDMCPRRTLHDAHRIPAPPPHQPFRWFLGWWRSLRAWWVVFRASRDTQARYRAWWVMWGSALCLLLAAHNPPSGFPALLALVLWAIVHEHFNAMLKSGK